MQNPNKSLIQAAIVSLIIIIILSITITYSYSEVYVKFRATIIDGDSIRIIDRKNPKIRYNVRIMGINAPEIRHAKCEEELKNGIKAKNILNSILTDPNNTITIKWELRKKDKYGRMLAHVYVNGENIANRAIREGWARPYKGGSRKSWCE